MVAPFRRRSHPRSFWSANRAARHRIYELRRLSHPPVHVTTYDGDDNYLVDGPDWNNNPVYPMYDWNTPVIWSPPSTLKVFGSWGTDTIDYSAGDGSRGWGPNPAPLAWPWGPDDVQTDGEAAEKYTPVHVDGEALERRWRESDPGWGTTRIGSGSRLDSDLDA
ncbi:hypothetical protein B0H16DRAFT_1743239 [Mycena metata]|uniref:Uncharacterized protein n=1 Tax=Mycena metata TaxID=1033252 RepID=A0AAD7MEU0_9AGAR|nr:hypothetical protein B0H16DRAFT_1743239 [Mycena metata]